MSALHSGLTSKAGVNDLVMLSTIDEDSIMENLRKRYAADLIYTYIGPVVIAVNPFKDLRNSTLSILNSYRNRYMYELPPHIYALADDTYRQMVSTRKNQCVIITGESGAGKTESAKLIMQFIAATSSGDGDATGKAEHVKQVILESNPVLEAFGNAKTTQNNNSSRFGKYMEILFDFRGVPQGGRINNYLLEKSRVVTQGANERNFHIFYQLVAGAPDSLKQQCDIQGLGVEAFEYFKDKSASKVPGIDDKTDFQVTSDAMVACGMTPEERDGIFRVLAGILHLGNVAFEGDSDSSHVTEATKVSLGKASKLFGTTDSALQAAICSRTVNAGVGMRGGPGRASAYLTPINPEQAAYARDALSKAIYARIFQLLVTRINASIARTDGGSDDVVIGVLDIYGFEIFEHNSFEQLCINFVNEKLQQIFLDLTLRQEQEEYVSEGIEWQDVDYIDNIETVELIEKTPHGLLSMLDEECVVPNGNEKNFTSKFKDRHAKVLQAATKSSDVQRSKTADQDHTFRVNHYAGTVQYDTHTWIEKNKDTLFNDLIELCQRSTEPLLALLFQDDDAGSKKRPPTVGKQFKKQVDQLCTSLRTCTPHYVRCIKPNNEKKAKVFNMERSREQVRYLGILEGVRVRRAGYAFRMEYPIFLNRYKMLCADTWPHYEGEPRDGVQLLLQSQGIVDAQYAMGKTKIFIRQPQTLFSLEELRERKLHDIVALIQATYRSYRIRKIAMMMREIAKDIYGKRKERRAASVSIKFFGDYLHLRDSPAIGKTLTKFGETQVLFSHDIMKKEAGAKFGMQARVLMLTEAAFYNLVPKSFKVKRRIAFEEVGAISLSPYMDGYFCLHLPNDYDYVMECKNKTEMVTLLREHLKAKCQRDLEIRISDTVSYKDKKGRTYTLAFTKDEACAQAVATGTGTTMSVRIKTGNPP